MLNRRPIVEAVPRVAFGAACAWILVVYLYGRSDAAWWVYPIRTAVTIPVIAVCAITAVRYRPTWAIWSASLLVGWAVIQVLRLQWSDYGWRPLLVATATYTFVAVLGAVLGVLSVLLTTFTSAGRRTVSDVGAQ